MFCVSCGAKLDLERVLPASGKRRGRSAMRAVRVLILLVLLAALGLILWPYAIPGRIGSKKDATQFYGKIKVLDRSVQSRAELLVRFSEPELNAYFLALLMRDGNPEGRGWQGLELQAINFRLTDGPAELVLRSTLGPLVLSYRFLGEPVFNGELFEVDLKKVELGHLPVPAFAHGLVLRTVRPVFREFDREFELLNHLDGWETGAGQAAVIYTP